MRVEDLSDAIGKVEEKLVMEADKGRRVIRRGRRVWMQWVAIAACLCLIAGGVLALPRLQPQGPGESDTPVSSLPVEPSEPKVSVLAEAIYPDRAASPLPPLTEFHDVGAGDNLPAFYQKVLNQYLLSDESENRVFSPLNVYMALALLAECSGEKSREEILDLLGIDDIDTLRRNTQLLWEVNFDDGKFSVSRAANSLWMRDDMPYNQESLSLLAEKYYASSFAGEMGSSEYDAKLHEWLNEQTGGLLQDKVDGLTMDASTVLTLVSSMYFGARWLDEFDPSQNAENVFHAAKGDVSATFMHKESFTTVHVDERYKSINLGLDTYQLMLFLPNKGVSVNSLIEDGSMMEAVKRSWDASYEPKFYDVQLSLPKFDISQDMDLVDGLKELGVKEVFDSQKANFTPILDESEGVSVQKMQHASRLSIDEQGCTAASFVVDMMGMGAPLSNGPLEMNFDRPFAFCLVGHTGDILYAGVVEQP